MLVAPHAMLHLGPHPAIPSLAFTSSVVIGLLLFVSGFLWCCSALLAHHAPDAIRAAYRRQPAPIRRNIPVYLVHIVLDPVTVILLFPPMLAGWMGCTETILTSPGLVGFMLQYLAVSYAVELMWKVRVDSVQALHHVCTIVCIAVLAGEAAPYLYRSADAVLLLAYFALLEQPTNLAMLAQRLLPEGSAVTAKIWRVALVLGLLLKTVSLCLAGWLIWRDRGLMPGWAAKLLFVVWIGMGIVQALSGRSRLMVCRKAVQSAEQPFKRRRC